MNILDCVCGAIELNYGRNGRIKTWGIFLVYGTTKFPAPMLRTPGLTHLVLSLELKIPAQKANL